MYRIIIYENNGKSPVKELLEDLNKTKNKDSLIKLKKINLYIRLLSQRGLALREPYIKKIENNIWELRPLRYRIIFTIKDECIILIHYFIKKTRKTPIDEIVKARRIIELINKEENYE